MQGSIFGSLFVKALELLGCPLGPFLGVLRLFWDASGPQKTLKNNRFLRFLHMQDFASFKVLVFVLGPSSLLFGQIWAQNWPPKKLSE